MLLNLNKPDHMPKGSKISNNATGQLTPIGVRFHKLVRHMGTYALPQPLE